MTWHRDLQGDWILGSFVMEEKTRAFRLEKESGELILDDLVGGAPKREYTTEEKTQAEAMLKLACDKPVRQVRVGEYLCHTCGKWIKAGGGQWSLGLCFSCSMDRDSDRWD